MQELLPSQPAPDEAMSWSQIYATLDSRARDLRTVMMTCLAGMLAMGAGFANSLHDLIDTPDETYRVYYFGGISLVLFAAGMLCCLQSRRTVRRAEEVRKHFTNRNDVPVVDRIFKISEIARPSEHTTTTEKALVEPEPDPQISPEAPEKEKALQEAE